MLHTLPELPFELDALVPHISKETLEYHYGKHHRKYVDTLNKLIKGTTYETMSLEQIIQNSTGEIFNNAAQAWNHSFYWQCLRPSASSNHPSADLQRVIMSSFGTAERLQEKFLEAAEKNFGSGWTWLLVRNDGLEIENTDDADVPHHFNERALLVCDVWEHAYYIDYRNDRSKYLSGFWHLVNWDHASMRFAPNRKAA